MFVSLSKLWRTTLWNNSSVLHTNLSMDGDDNDDNRFLFLNFEVNVLKQVVITRQPRCQRVDLWGKKILSQKLKRQKTSGSRLKQNRITRAISAPLDAWEKPAWQTGLAGFAEIPLNPRNSYKKQLAITWEPGWPDYPRSHFSQPGSRQNGLAFSHVIAPARLTGLENDYVIQNNFLMHCLNFYSHC